jgi:hypothetical protein
MSSAEKAKIPEFRPNANGAARSLEEALSIAKKNGVEMPSFVKVVVDPNVPIGKSFAEYSLSSAKSATEKLSWAEAARDGQVIVRVNPAVLKSDEAIVGVLQHEAYELSELKRAFDERGALSAGEIGRLISPAGERNLHGQAWDIADLRVLIMREGNAAKKAELVARLETLLKKFHEQNG